MFVTLIAATLIGFHHTPRLDTAATFIAHKPVQVMCADSEWTWLHSPAGFQPEFGFAYPGEDVIYLRPVVCKNLLVLPKNRKNYGFGSSVYVLAHEAVHARGEVDEGKTACAAIHEMPRMSVKVLKVKPGKDLRAEMADAWRFRKGEPESYHTVC